jgi:hypothetical protein
VARRGPPTPGQGIGRAGIGQAGGLSSRNTNPARSAKRPWMRLRGVKPFVRGSLRGFAPVQPPIHVVVDDYPLLIGKKDVLANPSASPVIAREGRHPKLDGKAQYAAIIQWRDHRPAYRSSAGIVELGQRHRPDKVAVEVS